MSQREELPPLRIEPGFTASLARQLGLTQRETQAALRVTALLEEHAKPGNAWFWEGLNAICALRSRQLEDAALEKTWEGSPFGAALRGAAKECRDFPKFLADQAREFRRLSGNYFRNETPPKQEAT